MTFATCLTRIRSSTTVSPVEYAGEQQWIHLTHCHGLFENVNNMDIEGNCHFLQSKTQVCDIWFVFSKDAVVLPVAACNQKDKQFAVVTALV